MSFDYKKYIQDNKLGPYSKEGTPQNEKEILKESGEIFEAPKPPAEDDIYAKEENAWIEDLKKRPQGVKVGTWTLYYEETPGVLVWMLDGDRDADFSGEEMMLYATPQWDDPNTTSVELEIQGEFITSQELGLKEIDRGVFDSLQDYANTIQKYVLVPLESKIKKGDLKDFGITETNSEIEEMDAATGDEIEFANENDTQDDFDYDNEQFPDANERIMGLGGDRLLKIVKDLTDDGFELEDIFDFIASMHEKGDNSAEDAKAWFGTPQKLGDLYESEVQCVKKSDGYYYMVNDEHQKVSGPYSDQDCHRRVSKDGGKGRKVTWRR